MGTVYFGRRGQDLNELSNFYPCRIVYEGIAYKNAEAAWQSLKTKDPEKRTSFGTLSGSAAKKAGRKLSLRPDWEEVKYELMKRVCLAKFQQNPKLEEVLLSTGEELLEEDTTGWHDNIWGNCTCSKCKAIPGKNLLGKTLMEVRKTLKEQKEEKVKRPDLRRNSSGNQS